MRIAILSPFYPYRGGIAQFSVMLYAELIKEGHEVEVFNFKRLYPDVLFPGKTQYVEDEDTNLSAVGKRDLDSINPFSYHTTLKDIKAYQPEVLIVSYWMSFFVPGYTYIANGMKKRCKIITLIHNAIPHEPHFFDKPLAGLFFRQCNGFIVMSENVAKDLQSLYPGAKYILKSHPLYNQFGDKITKQEACSRLQIPYEKKTLLFFGLIRDYKGLDLLIDALNFLDDSYQLMIAGECYGSFEKYQARIDASTARNRIFVHDRYIDDSEIPVFFSAADALILPYRTVTQSGIVSIALHYELPMLGTPIGDFINSIGKAGTGVIAHEITPEAIAESVRELLSAEKYPVAVSNIKKEKVELSWKKFAESLITFAGKL